MFKNTITEYSSLTKNIIYKIKTKLTKCFLVVWI